MRPRVFLKAALVVGVAFLMGGVVGAVVSPVFSPFSARRKLASPPTVTRPPAEQRRPRAVPPASTTEVLPQAPATDSIAEVTEPAPIMPGRGGDEPKRVLALTEPVRRLALRGATPPTGANRVPLALAPLTMPPPVAPSPAAFPPVASAIAVEQTLLGQAMRTLRGGQDARTALTLLAQHAERFPQGAFASEAMELRIEALLALEQGDDALAVLDGAALASLPNRDEQRVVRGELRAAHQRWREAAQDFDDMLAERRLPAANPKVRNLQGRALWGRAAARSRLGDAQGARADLDLYLRYFPDGQFAGRAATLVKAAP